MMPDRPINRSLPWMLGLSAVALLSVGGGAWLTFQQLRPGDVAPITVNSPIPATGELSVYWLNAQGTGLVNASVSGRDQNNREPETLLKAGFSQLLAGPTSTTVATTIPQGTQLQSLAIKPDGIHLNLSQEFTKGGGSTSMQGRLGQVIYTATSLNPQAPVWISVAGKPLTILGGEGVEVTQPMSRADFETAFSLKGQSPTNN